MPPWVEAYGAKTAKPLFETLSTSRDGLAQPAHLCRFGHFSPSRSCSTISCRIFLRSQFPPTPPTRNQRGARRIRISGTSIASCSFSHWSAPALTTFSSSCCWVSSTPTNLCVKVRGLSFPCSPSSLSGMAIAATDVIATEAAKLRYFTLLCQHL